MKNVVVLVCAFFMISNCFSQEDITWLRGQIVKDSLYVSGVTVTNTTINRSIVADDEGMFDLPVHVGDSVLIHAIHIKNVSFQVTDKLLEIPVLVIDVNDELTELDEVQLNTILSASATDFSEALKPTIQPDFMSIQRSQVARLANTDPISGGNTGLNLMNGINKVIDVFKKDGKSKKELKLENLQQWDRFKVEFIDEFGYSFFTEELGLPKAIVNEFLSFCRGKKDIAAMYSNNQKLELLEYFVKESKNYKSIYFKTDE